MKILIPILFFEIKEGKTTRGHNFTLVKKQSVLNVREFSFSQRTTNVWNTLSTLARIPVEGKSSECLICMKYRIIILIIIISLGQIFYRILQTHHACTHARVYTRTRAHACTRTHTRTRAHARTHVHTHSRRRRHRPPHMLSLFIGAQP